jgi:hypothetical protein
MNTTYGSFTKAERRDVSARMEIPWEGGLLETVIQQIQEASDAFGLGGAQLSDTQMRDKLYDLVSTSNLLPKACQQWCMRQEADKTWDQACTPTSSNSPMTETKCKPPEVPGTKPTMQNWQS